MLSVPAVACEAAWAAGANVEGQLLGAPAIAIAEAGAQQPLAVDQAMTWPSTGTILQSLAGFGSVGT